jgi:RNA polymerase sigma-70 factor (ECF subfamily)
VSKAEDARRAEFTAVALAYMDQLYSSALHLSRDADQAADLLQETYLRAFRSWHQFKAGTNCKAWLLTILYNAFRSRYRADRNALPLVELDETAYLREADPTVSATADDPADLLALQVLDGDVQTALARLPEEYRTAVMLVDVHELTYEEAAAVVGSPVGTIRSRLSRGRQLLQAALRGYARERGLLRRR